MSKFILSNVGAVKKTVAKSEKAGFSLSGQSERSGSFIFSSFHKLGMKNENFLQINDDFISVVGTIIYNNRSGEPALRNIYEDFKGVQSIESIRDFIIGNGAIIIKKAGSLYVFTDNYALFALYYIVRDSEYVICNNLIDIASTISVEPNWNNIYEKIWIGSIFCGGTYFKDVYRLSDDKCIVIDCATSSVSLSTIKSSWVSDEKMSYESIVDVVSKSLISNATEIIKSFGTPALSSTGGLDNRLNLASFLAAGAKPSLYYGIGNSTVTNTYNEDAEIDRLYSAKYGLTFNTMKWTTPDPINKDWKKLFEQFGEHYELYAGSDAIFNGYITIDSKSIFFGYFGEMYRNLDFINKLQSDYFSIDYYIDNYLMPMTDPKEIIINDMASFKRYLRNQLLSVCEKWNLNPDHISNNDEVYLSLERRLEGDSRLVNWINYHHYSCFLLGQKQCLKYVLSVDTGKRENSRFMIDLLLKIYPSIMEVPVFTHTHYMMYDKNTNSLKLPASKKFINTVKSSIPFYDKIIRSSFGKEVKRLFKNKKKKEEVIHDRSSQDVIEEIMTKHGLVKGVDYGGCSTKGGITRTITYLQILEMLDNAKPLL